MLQTVAGNVQNQILLYWSLTMTLGQPVHMC